MKQWNILVWVVAAVYSIGAWTAPEFGSTLEAPPPPLTSLAGDTRGTLRPAPVAPDQVAGLPPRRKEAEKEPDLDGALPAEGDPGDPIGAEGTTPPGEGPGRAKEGLLKGAALGKTSARGLNPPALNLFQEFVLRLKNRRLPIFGLSLFQRNTYGERQVAPIPSDYVVGPGDEILIKIYGSTVDVDQRLMVDRQGIIVLPKVGPVPVAGVKVGDLERLLKSKISRVLTDFKLFATMGQLRGIEVYAVGQALRPGKYVVSSLSTVINALFATGGPNVNGSLRNIELVRNGKVITTVDLYEFIAKGDTSKDHRLLSGDVINIKPVGPQVALLGALPNPAIFELKGEGKSSLKDILALAGGLNVQMSLFEGSLERVDPSKQKPFEAMKLSLAGSGLATELKAGDLVTLFPIKAAFENSVTLRIMQAEPVRVPVGTETRIRDILPSKEAILTSEYYLRQFEGANTDLRRLSKQNAKARLQVYQKDQVNWEHAIIERINPENFSTSLISFNLGKVFEDDPSSNLVLKPGDTISVFNRQEIEVPLERKTQVVVLQGEVQKPGVYQALPGETLTALIARAGGLSAHAYPFGTVFTRSSVKARQRDNIEKVIRQLDLQLKDRIARSAAQFQSEADRSSVNNLNEQNTNAVKAQIAQLQELTPLGRISLEMDAEKSNYPDFILEDGDEVTVPPLPGYVSVIGAVHNDNVLIFHKGAKVSSYLKVAGVTEFAERDNMFVLRADGSIVSSQDRNVERVVLYPGDTVVVPEKVYAESGYSSFMRGLKDWTQVIFQLGLSAATIRVLSK